MPEKIIQQLIKGEYIFEGRAINVPVNSVVIGTGLANNAGDLISECGLKGRALVVSDVNTHAVLGARIESALGVLDKNSLIFEHGVKADIANVERVKAAADSFDYMIAIGSGTISDLCKYASFLINKPYIVFGTAPSMNGYGSANASITIDGHKKTLKAHLPQGIFLDLDVLTKAPVRLIRSGLGDSLCRSTAQADWLLSHCLLDTFYTELPFLILKSFEADLFANSAALVNGDAEIMRLLAATLVLSGFGMYLAGGSYPASQGEHMIAHSIEMVCGNELSKSYHGEQIGVTTLIMSEIQEKACRKSFLSYKNVNFPCDWNLQPEILKECRLEFAAKQFSKKKLEDVNALLQNDWGDIRKRILSVMLPYKLLEKTLADAGCPLRSTDIDWSDSVCKDAVLHARFSRNRFTFIDI